MKTNNSRIKILDQSSYWVEGINGFLYNSIIDYMEKNKLNRTKLADHLGISKGRVSQILNDGEINFSLEKLIEISLKVDKYPLFELIDRDKFLKKEEITSTVRKYAFEPGQFFNSYEDEIQTKRKPKVISLNETTKRTIEIKPLIEYTSSGI